MVANQRVIAWIDDLPDSFVWHQLQTRAKPTPPPSQVSKPNTAQEPTPPATVSDMDDPETPARKKPRLDRLTDPELTPRPQHEISNDPMKAPSLSGSNASGRSRSTSPLKRQFLELHLDETGMETKALSVDALEALPNPDAASLLRIMRRIGTCKGILPDDRREELLKSHNIKENDLDEWDSTFKRSSAFADLPGRIPSPEEIDLVREWTTECIELKHEEAGWNDEVHFRLLQAVFREPGKKKGGLFNVTTR